MMRPAVYLSLQGEKKPEVLTTVFAGQDMEATQRTREYITGYPPSSPSVALFKDGELVYFMERHQHRGAPPGGHRRRPPRRLPGALLRYAGRKAHRASRGAPTERVGAPFA